ncbi:MAG TPA: hypothetical protein VF064_15765, partial [Pyrinomonadaceae bacterium]
MTLWIIAGLVLLCLLCVGLVVYLAVSLDIEHVRHRQRIEGEKLLQLDNSDARSVAAQSPEAGEAVAEKAPPFDGAEEVFRVEDAPPEQPLAATDVADSSVAESETDVYALAWAMDEYFNRSSHPKDLLLHEKFSQGIELLRGEAYTAEDLLTYSRGPNVVVGCMALEALARRAGESDITATLVAGLNDYFYWPRYFALRALDARARRPVLAEVLARAGAGWRDFVPMQSLREFAARRRAAGEEVSADEIIDYVSRHNFNDEQLNDVAGVVEELGDALAPSVGAEFALWRGERVDLEFLKSIGRVWEPGREEDGGVVLLDAVAERVRELEAAL